MDYLERYSFWCNAGLPASVCAELKRIESDHEELKKRFGSELQFGTAGMRGIMGIDFVTIPYYTKDGSLIIEEPVRYTIKYYTGEAYPIKYIEKEYADPERFKLNYYSISVGIDSDEQMNYLDCKAVLYDAINKQESLSNEFSDKFTDQNAIFDVPELISGGERGDFELAYRYNLIYDLNETDEKMSIRINFDDKMYAKLDRLEFKPNTNDYIYTITIN